MFDDYPPLPHFSTLIGAAHNANVKLREPGAVASDGIESMAEDGLIGILSGEIDAYLKMQGTRGPTFSPRAFPIRPSPDWFVGVESLDLCEGPGWKERVRSDAYDAGTDDGTIFTAPNDDTSPREPIAQIMGAPFNEGPGNTPFRVGTFTFELQ